VRQQVPSHHHSPFAYKILAYLAEHPDADDTLEGIMEWWLLEQRIKHWAVEVQAALAGLVAQGLVLERRDRAGRTHYYVNRRKMKKVEELLKRVAEEDSNNTAL
jgi:hypothetical protein